MPLTQVVRRAVTARAVVAGMLPLTLLAAACNRAAPAPPAPSANAWAVVDGREITADAVEKAYRRNLPPDAAPSLEEALNAKLNLLNEMIVQDILIAKAAALKIEVPEAELNTAFDGVKKDVPDASFQQELSRRNLTADDLREGLRREMLVQKVLEKEVLAKASVSDQEIADFYNANKAQFNLPEESYHLAQIVVTPVADQGLNNRAGNDATTPQQAAQKAQMLMERLKAGAPFADLARDFSEDPQTGPRGGDLGFVPISALRGAPPALRDAVLKAEPGTVNVVSAAGGHTIVLLIAKETAGQRELKDPAVQERITATLKARKEQLLRAAFLGAARDDATVVNYIARQLVEGQGKVPGGIMPAAPGSR
jgi:peptidyl-prolyl cis-trans isomerase SurA